MAAAKLLGYFGRDQGAIVLHGDTVPAKPVSVTDTSDGHKATTEQAVGAGSALGAGTAGAGEGQRQGGNGAKSSRLLDEDPSLLVQMKETLAKARRLFGRAPEEDADEMRPLISQLEQAIQTGQDDRAREICQKLDDLVFYRQDTAVSHSTAQARQPNAGVPGGPAPATSKHNARAQDAALLVVRRSQQAILVRLARGSAT